VTLPNFFVIGEARSGTTSLHYYLGQHPNVYMCPVKEPNYFAFDGVGTTLRGPAARWLADTSVLDDAAYSSLFNGVNEESAIGEVSPRYLSAPDAAKRIYAAVPNAKIIAILRQPTDRAFASFLGGRREGWEPCESFEESLADLDRRLSDVWSGGCYEIDGYYASCLSRYFDLFSPTQIRVHLYEEFVRDPEPVVRDLFNFLEIDTEFQPDLSITYNPSGQIRNPVLRTFWRTSYLARKILRPQLPKTLREAAYAWITRDLVKPRLLEVTRGEITERYRDDIRQLEKMLDRDLSHWLP